MIDTGSCLVGSGALAYLRMVKYTAMSSDMKDFHG